MVEGNRRKAAEWKERRAGAGIAARFGAPEIAL
jgi:hypothetical protein